MASAKCFRLDVVLISTVLFGFGLVLASDCDFSLVSGNVTFSGETAIIRISEKKYPDALCALEAEGVPKITCDLTSTYFDCSENTFPDDNKGLNVSLVASVDEVADKPTNIISWIGLVSCSRRISTDNLDILVNLILVQVDTVNDHTPGISSYSLDIPDLPETFPFGDHRFELVSIYGLQITASDNDTAGDATSRVQFAITGGNDLNIFSIATVVINQNRNDEYFVAKLYLEIELDYSKQPNFTLIITAMDQGVPSLESSVPLTIVVTPQNTRGPVFDYDFYRANINESLIDGGQHEINMQPEDIHSGVAAANRPDGDDVIYSMLIDDCGTSCDAIMASFSVGDVSGKIMFDSVAPYLDVDNLVAIFGVKATWTDAYKRSSTAIVTIYLPSTPTTTSTQKISVTPTTEPTTSGRTTETTTSGRTTETTIPTRITTSRSTTTSTSCTTCPPCPSTTTMTDATWPSTNSTTTETSINTQTASSTSVATSRTTPCDCPSTTTVCPTAASTKTTFLTTPSTGTTSHQGSTTPAIPIPVPNLEFYETVNVPVTTLITGVILVIRFHDDVTKIYTYTATDCYGYHLGSTYFDLDESTGSVAIKQQLIVNEFCLNVTATSASSLERNYKAIIINVFNGTLEEILAEDYFEVHINESKEDATLLLVDLDSFYEEKQLAIYTLETQVESGFFFLNSSSGELFAIKGLDHESHPVYQLIISVSSRKAFLNVDYEIVDDIPNVQYGNLSLNDVLVRVIVDDVNDNAPQFDVGSSYAIAITSYVGERQTVMTLTATDADDTEAYKRIYYSIADREGPFFVNQDSGILRATNSLEVLENSDVTTYDFHVTAANSADGQIMPNQLHLTVYILESDEILVMSTLCSGIEFDKISSQIIDTFKDKLNVDVRIIQWETNADGGTVAFMYLLPLQNTARSLRVKRFTTSGDGPLRKKEMLRMIKDNAESLKDFFVTDTAKTYDDLPQSNNNARTSGLLAAVVVLATVLGLIIVVGAVVGFLLHRKFIKENHSYVNKPSIETNHNYEDLLPVNTRIDVIPANYYVESVTESNFIRESFSESLNSDRSETCETKNEEKLEPEIIARSVITLSDLEILYSEPEPELDYLKSILVDHEKVPKMQKPIVKFADDVTSKDDSTDTDDVRL